MKITLEVPDNTCAMVVTTIFGDSPKALHMNTTNVTTKAIKDGVIVNAMPEEEEDD